MAYTTINKHTDYFNTKLYTGTGSSNALTGVGFQPDLVWLKSRSAGWDHEWYDNVRGAGYSISSVTSNAQGSSPQGVTAFNSDGFTVGTRSGANQSSQTYAAWNWKANGQGSPNTAGTINTTYTSVNTTAGFSIIKYTGNGTANATIGHGLGVEPAMIFFKRTDSANNWIVYQKTMGTGHYLTLNTSGTKDSASGAWCTPSSTLIQLNQVFGATNTNNATYIAYCFAEKTGYSRFGSYTGNSNANGTFIYLGFKPSFIMVKRTDTGNSYDNWIMYDNKRSGYNVDNDRVHADISDVENTDNTIDILSNGFKIRSNNSNLNGGTHIYMAFGQSLVGSNNVPCTAR